MAIFKTVKVTDEHLTLIGATVENFGEKFSEFVAASKKLETTMSAQPSISDLVARIVSIEGRTAGVTEARVSELIGASQNVSGNIETFLKSEGGQKLIFAEASRAVIASAAATGTLPVKDSPAPPAGVNSVAELIKAGKFEDAYTASAELKNEFPDAKNYAAYMKANAAGQVRIVQKN